MSTDSVQALAERWIATKNTARPSPNTVLARQYDLNAVAKRLPAGSMETLPLSDVSLANLERAFADYASTHAASSTSRVMSTWKQFCLWLVREKLIDGEHPRFRVYRRAITPRCHLLVVFNSDVEIHVVEHNG